MKTTLGFMTEEGRTRLKNAIRRSGVYALGMIVLAGVGGYAIHRYWVSANLTTLQRVYFNQYLKSSYKSYLPNSMSRYRTLSRVVTDPKAKKDISLAVRDDQIMPVLDEAGHIQLDKDQYPMILLREGIEHKQYRWEPITTFVKQAYEWFNQHIYGGKSIHSVFAMLAHGENKADLDRFGTPTAVRFATLGRIGRPSDNRALRNWAAHLTSKNDVMRACGRWPFPFLRNGDYPTPAFTDSPPCAPLRSPARATRRAYFATAPAGG
jgi:hypothetical protein